MTGQDMRLWASFGCPMPGCKRDRLTFWVGWLTPRFVTGFCSPHYWNGVEA